MAASLARAQLKAYEDIIRQGRKTFLEVGEALRKIRDGRLFRERGYTTFADYCEGEWGWSKSYVDRTIAGAKPVLEGSVPIGTIKNEAQARALRAVPEDKREQVLSRVQERVAETGEPITARLISESARPSVSAEPVCSGRCPVHCP